jgi:large subunit ribosomal protein L18
VIASVSGRYVYAQIIKPKATGDITLCSASSRDLAKKFGWKGSAKNLPGAFLTGFYLGKLAEKSKLESVVFYSGVGRFVHGSRVASLLDGAKTAGLKVEVGEESLPEDAREKGEHIVKFAKTLEAEDKENFRKSFSRLLSSGFNPANYPSHFEEVKAAIEKSVK